MKIVRLTLQAIAQLLPLAIVLVPDIAAAQLKFEPYITSGLTQPTEMVQDPSDPTVQYVLEKGGPSTPTGIGRIRVIKDGVLRDQPFLEVPVQTTDECGMGGLVFAPDYATTRRFWVYFCLPQGNAGYGNTVIARFLRSANDPYTADPSTRFDFEFPGEGANPPQRFIYQPGPIHKAGKMLFGQDGYLYVSIGDGGTTFDEQQNAQNIGVLRGKILRLDVNVPLDDPKGYRIPPDNPFIALGGLGELWDSGLRNPWKMSFDDVARGGTGALIIADVGESAFEEVNYEPAGKGGRNYQWPLREGMHNFLEDSRVQGPGRWTPPFYEYDHAFGHSIIGGYVYRGDALPATYRGRYFACDFITKKVVSLRLNIDGAGEATLADQIDHSAELNTDAIAGPGFTSIDIDSKGELYFLTYDGQILKLVSDADRDTDGDGLPDSWETAFGLDPGSTDGINGANADPDGDGQTNLQEFQAGTHPRNNASFTRYFAEGASSGFFETSIALANAGSQPAVVNLRYLRSDGAHFSQPVTVPALGRATVRPADDPGLANATFSTIVETDQEVVAERTMYWPAGVRYGSHSETAVKAPATTWYLAEGATLGEFDMYYLIENPNPAPTTIEVTYLRLAPAAPIVKQYTVGANSRLTIAVQDEAPELFDAEISAVVRSVDGTSGIIVERAMYLNGGNELWRAGHDAAGVTALSPHWFFAEGATGGFFDMFLLLANPNETEANVTLRFLRPGGLDPIVVTRTVAPHSRWTENVEGADPALAAETMSTVVESDQPIAAERAMYWPGLDQGGWYEGADSAGVTETGQAWVVADGEYGGQFATQTYVLVANTSPFAGRARLTLLTEDGSSVPPREIDVPANGRVTSQPFADVANGKRFGVLVESIPASDGAAAAEIVVERATYSNDSTGLLWSAGASAVATKVR